MRARLAVLVHLNEMIRAPLSCRLHLERRFGDPFPCIVFLPRFLVPFFGAIFPYQKTVPKNGAKKRYRKTVVQNDVAKRCRKAVFVHAHKLLRISGFDFCKPFVDTAKLHHGFFSDLSRIRVGLFLERSGPRVTFYMRWVSFSSAGGFVVGAKFRCGVGENRSRGSLRQAFPKATSIVQYPDENSIRRSRRQFFSIRFLTVGWATSALLLLWPALNACLCFHGSRGRGVMGSRCG